MNTNTSLEELQFLLEKETAARKAAEAKLIQKELEWKMILDQPGYQSILEKKKEIVTADRLFRDVVTNLPGIVFQIQKKCSWIICFQFCKSCFAPIARFKGYRYQPNIAIYSSRR